MVTNKVYVRQQREQHRDRDRRRHELHGHHPVGINPTCVAVNPVTNKVYVVNCSINGTITVIDGATDTVTGNIFVGSDPGRRLPSMPLTTRFTRSPIPSSLAMPTLRRSAGSTGRREISLKPFQIGFPRPLPWTRCSATSTSSTSGETTLFSSPPQNTARLCMMPGSLSEGPSQ